MKTKLNLFLYLLGIDIVNDNNMEQRTENYINKSKEQQDKFRAMIEIALFLLIYLYNQLWSL